jgi:hypothetical protein
MDSFLFFSQTIGGLLLIVQAKLEDSSTMDSFLFFSQTIGELLLILQANYGRTPQQWNPSYSSAKL